jgi:hypothetical protein
MAVMAKKDIEELRKLRVSKIAGFWANLVTVSITLNDGSTC